MSGHVSVRSGLCCLVCITALLGATQRAEAQLRPLEPLPAPTLAPTPESAHTLTAVIGASTLRDQRASLAGTMGTLSEIANFSLGWRTGRVLLELSGTAARRFREDSRFAPADAEVVAAPDDLRLDAGDLRLSTTVRLTREDAPLLGTLRFGVRLPTTDNRTGLDRDATDIFVLLGGAAQHGALWLAADLGLGIHGTREVRYEQEEVLLYAVRAELRRGRWTPIVMALGQMHARTHPDIRGVENLGELRAGVRWGGRRWLQVEGVRGFTPFSPSAGLRVSLGTSVR